MYRELQKVTLMDMPHYSRFLFPPKKSSSRDCRLKGRLKRQKYSLTQTSLNANSSGIQTDNVGPHKENLQNSPNYSRPSLLSKPSLLSPTPRILRPCLLASNASSPDSLAPPASFFQPHAPKWMWLHRVLLFGDVLPSAESLKEGKEQLSISHFTEAKPPQMFLDEL